MSMFCYQCEQTAAGKACSVKGVCGKDPIIAALQDLLIYGVKGLSMYAHRARKLGKEDREIDLITLETLFTTVTNVNFAPEVHKEKIIRLSRAKNRAKEIYHAACSKKGIEPEILDGPALWEAADADSLSKLIAQGERASMAIRQNHEDKDILSLQELLVYGLKGIAAYADHAYILGKENNEIFAFFHEALDYICSKDQNVDELLEYTLRAGKINLKTMELLDKAHTDAFGHPEPTRVRVTPVKGKSILVSGHDLKDLEELLKQTDGKNINIYTHGEMLPACAYPGLKKYKHLVGNYGGAWQDQQKEFAEFPGAILMTTNCIQEPKEVYRGRIFTTGLVGWPGVTHIKDKDFKDVITAAYDSEGFKEDAKEQYITIGFGHNAVLKLADKVVGAVKKGKIKHFFLIGGCDGAKSGRNYYTEFAQSLPKDTVMLTLACGKYRFNKLEFGEIEGIPRLLDVGQCNDAYSAVQIALALSEAFNVGVNELPLSMILSWYEQKAVAILLTLLSLGVKNIRLGPSMPAFVSPNVLKVLVEKFNIMPITTVEEDLKSIFADK